MRKLYKKHTQKTMLTIAMLSKPLLSHLIKTWKKHVSYTVIK